MYTHRIDERRGDASPVPELDRDVAFPASHVNHTRPSCESLLTNHFHEPVAEHAAALGLEQFRVWIRVVAVNVAGRTALHEPLLKPQPLVYIEISRVTVPKVALCASQTVNPTSTGEIILARVEAVDRDDVGVFLLGLSLGRRRKRQGAFHIGFRCITADTIF